jgi:hypothetical protein
LCAPACAAARAQIIAAKVELSMALQGQLTQFKLQLQKEERGHQTRLTAQRAKSAKAGNRGARAKVPGSNPYDA